MDVTRPETLLRKTGGTMAQWAQIKQNIKKDVSIFDTLTVWWNGTGEFTVHCADGDIAKKDAVHSKYNLTLEEVRALSE